MVRVVKVDPHPSVVKEIVCAYCGVTLEYVPADIQKKTVSDYLGDKDTVHFIECPPCGYQQPVRGY